MVKRLAFIVSIFVSFVVLMEVAFRDYTSYVDYAFSGIAASDDPILILGNSHLGVLRLDSLSGGGVHNACIGGQDWYHARQLLEFAIKKGYTRKVVFSADDNLLGYTLSTTNQAYMDRQYFMWSGELQDRRLFNQIMARSNFFRSSRDFSWLLRRLSNGSPAEETTIDSKEMNFIPLESGSLDRRCSLRAREDYRVKYNGSLIESNKDQLRQVVSQCKGSGIELVLVNPPKRSCYLQGIDSLARAKMASFVNSIECDGYIYVDLVGSPIFTDDDFIDPDHLNTKGALKLASLLGLTERSVFP